jgi:hypothetical protein
MGLLAAMAGVWLTGGDDNIFTQIGLIVLVGLSAKYAILIVEFARELELAGRTPVQAAIEASRLRLRPILMTSLAFVMGVAPLVFSSGAGAEMRHAMGVVPRPQPDARAACRSDPEVMRKPSPANYAQQADVGAWSFAIESIAKPH